jgi:putative transposase
VTSTATTQEKCQAARDSRPDRLTRKRASELLGVSRSSTYYEPKKTEETTPEEDERLMAEIDRMHLESPAYGARKIARALNQEGYEVSRWHVRRLMSEMNVRPCCPLPSPSKPTRHSRKFGYLLRDKVISFPNQVWSTDITYVQIGGRHMYLTAIIDWYSRYIVSWRLSDTMRANEVVRCAEDAFREHGMPSIMNSDQGSVFGSEDYVSLLKSCHITQSMDGRGRWRDNVLVERWFRTLKSECLRTAEYSTPAELERLISGFVTYYNDRRIHQSLDYETPSSWYFTGITTKAA